jgi:hypothetical protein
MFTHFCSGNGFEPPAGGVRHEGKGDLMAKMFKVYDYIVRYEDRSKPTTPNRER